jgi:hypothetical protein
MINEIKESLSKITQGKWYAWNFPSAGWQVGTESQLKRGFNANVFLPRNIPKRHEIEMKCIEEYGEVGCNAWRGGWTQECIDREEADANFISNAPDYIKYLLKRIEELENK